MDAAPVQVLLHLRLEDLDLSFGPSPSITRTVEIAEGALALDAFLKSRTISLAEAARQIRVSKTTVFKWTHGQARPNAVFRRKIETWTSFVDPATRSTVSACPISFWDLPSDRAKLAVAAPCPSEKPPAAAEVLAFIRSWIEKEVAAGSTQASLGARLGLDATALSAVKRGRRMFGPLLQQRAAAALFDGSLASLWAAVRAHTEARS